MTKGPLASKVEQYVKYLSDAEPKDGWPAYSIHHSGPDIAKPQTILNRKFFCGPGFAIWIDEGIMVQCANRFAHMSSLSVSILITTFLSTILTVKWFNALDTSQALTVWQLCFTQSSLPKMQFGQTSAP